MDYDRWVEEYRPIKNELDKYAGFNGCLFETYAPHIQEVKRVLGSEPNKVWTLVESNDGGVVLSSGYHSVNSLGYFITEKPCIFRMDFVVMAPNKDRD